jgi:uncharacterized protein (DUF2267 family)
MSTASLDVFDRALQKATFWIDEMMTDLGWGDRHRTYEVLGVVLHVLRDRLPVQEAVDLGAQFPLLIRGLYYQNWDVSINPEKYRHAVDFLKHVRAGLLHHRLEAYSEDRLVGAVARLLSNRLSPGELASMRRALPGEVRELFGTRGRASGRTASDRWIDEERAWDKYSL